MKINGPTIREGGSPRRAKQIIRATRRASKFTKSVLPVCKNHSVFSHSACGRRVHKLICESDSRQAAYLLHLRNSDIDFSASRGIIRDLPLLSGNRPCARRRRAPPPRRSASAFFLSRSSGEKEVRILLTSRKFMADNFCHFGEQQQHATF
jgi:hypothetical protein